MTNEELAIRAKAGDSTSIEPLWEQVKVLTFQAAGRFFRRSLGRCASHGIALDDLQQECFLAVMDAMKAYDPERGLKFTSYLYFPLKNHLNAQIGCRGNQRKNPLNEAASLDKPLPGAEDPDFTLLGAIEDPSVNIQDSEEETAVQRIVRNAVQHLNPFQRFLIERQYFQDCTFEDIAQETGMELNEVKKHHRLALNALRKMDEIQGLKPFYVSAHAPRYYSEDPLCAAIWDW